MAGPMYWPRRGRRWTRCSPPRPISGTLPAAGRRSCGHPGRPTPKRAWRRSWLADGRPGFEPLDVEAAKIKRRLRELKAETHLLTALADLGGVWDLDQVTGALTRFADASVKVAMAAAVRGELERGRMIAPAGEDDGEAGPLPGLFCIAMGKYGAFELNYSSDIDFSLFYEPEALPLAEGVEHQGFTTRFAQTLADIQQERTSDGYVFRVDLRLRPDPSATPPAVPVEAALDYYQTVGQNWERAAFIKARVCAGDLAARPRPSWTALQPFVWRRNLDFAAIADIHSIKRQIHIYKVDERLTAKGADVKLGHGGIREIEFFVQTQQLILGGRDSSLRSSRTVDALAALAAAGRITGRGRQRTDHSLRRPARPGAPRPDGRRRADPQAAGG